MISNGQKKKWKMPKMPKISQSAQEGLWITFFVVIASVFFTLKNIEDVEELERTTKHFNDGGVIFCSYQQVPTKKSDGYMIQGNLIYNAGQSLRLENCTVEGK